MSIRPLRVTEDGSLLCFHDEQGHETVLAPQDVRFAKNLDGSANTDFIVLGCKVPECPGGESLHPLTGGAAPLEVQRLFAAVYKVSQRFGADNTWVKARKKAKDRIKELGGVDYLASNEPDPVASLPPNSLPAND